MQRAENQTDCHFFSPLDYKPIHSGSVTVAWQDMDGGTAEADVKDKGKVLYEQIIAALKLCQNYHIYEKSMCRKCQWEVLDFLWTLTFLVEDVSIANANVLKPLTMVENYAYWS